MIRRAAGDSFWLIQQVDHARFSGAIAEQLGANGFAPPTPRAEVIAAIAHHDDGWTLHDDQPTLNNRREPQNVFETPMRLATAIWSASVDRAMTLGPYTALLVSLHQLALADVASRQYDSAPHERTTSAKEKFELNKFQHRQVEIQEALRADMKMQRDLPLTLGLAQPGADAREDLLAFNFRLLSLCDRLSLQLCMGRALFPEIEEVRQGPGARAVDLYTHSLDDWTVQVTPWPFAADRVEAEVPARRVKAGAFETEGAFLESYRAAPVEQLKLGMRAG